MSDSYKICTKLVVDSSYPDVKFDEFGVSDTYNNFHSNVKQYWQTGANGKRYLEELVSSIKRDGRGKEFDCIMGLSGGLDSSYMLHKMVTEFELRPLVFHVDGGWNSELAVHNINVLVDKLGLDLYTEVINWQEMRDFQLAMFKSGVPHIDIPQDHSFIAVLYKFAREHGIKYILNGGNIASESVAVPLEIFYWGTDLVQIKDILNKFGSVPMKSYPFSFILHHKLYLRYFRGIKVFKPLNYMPFVKKDAISELQRVYDWKAFSQKHFESRFTRFFEGYWLPTRFGIDVRRAQFSSLILSGQMTREDALTRLEQPSYDSELMQQDFEYIAIKLGIDPDELSRLQEIPKKFYWDYRNLNHLFRLGEWVLSKVAGATRGGAF
jgi:N-acetyl sugar amidotransferase